MNKRMGSFLIFVWVFMLMCFPGPVNVYANEDEMVLKYKILEVPLFAQQTKMWCWAASGEMIMAYYGKEVTQCEQANNKFKRSDCCQGTGANHTCFKGGFPQFGKYGFNHPQSKYGALSWKELVSQINADKPVGFSWEWKQCKYKRQKSTGSHYMVARGYIMLNGMKLVVVNDPWPANPDKYKGGSLKVITYPDYVNFCSSYAHSYDQYNITKKEKIQEQEDILGPGIKTNAAGINGKGNAQPAEEITIDNINEALTQQKTARQSLDLLKQLPGPILEELGFKSKQMLNDSSLGEALQVYLVGLNLLKAFEANRDPVKILEDADEANFPVHVNEKSISSITIRKRNGKWVCAVIGKKEPLFAEQARLKQDASHPYFMVQVQPLYLTFLAYFSADKLYLIPTHEDPDLEFPLYKPVPAEEVFFKLKDYLLGKAAGEITGALLGKELKYAWKDIGIAYKNLRSGKKDRTLKGVVEVVKILAKVSNSQRSQEKKHREKFKAFAGELGGFTGKVYRNEFTEPEKEEIRTMPVNDYITFMKKAINVLKTSSDPLVTLEMKEWAGELLDFLDRAKPTDRQWLAEIYIKSLIEALY